MSETNAAAGPNAAQIFAWNERLGVQWAAMQASIDALFAPVTDLAIAAAAPMPGLRALDIGCGCGGTLIELARRVGPTGTALGVDISSPMLAVAESRIAAGGLAQASTVLADAATHAFAPFAFDLVFSRFGVMFFDDPVAAFRNIRGAVRPDGRLVFACWQPLAANQWFREPLAATLSVVGAQPPADPHAPGPFAFADPARVTAILSDAGFGGIAIEPRSVTLRFDDVEAATVHMTRIGPAARLLADIEPAVREAGRAAIADRLASLAGPDGVVLGGAIWLVSARPA